MPIHELAALGTALCWATTGVIAADAVRALGAFHFNLIRQLFVALCLAAIVAATGGWAGLTVTGAAALALSGVVGILLGDTLNFAAVARLGPRRAGAIFALNAPLAAALGWLLLGEVLPLQGVLGIVVATAGVALAILGPAPTPTAWRRSEAPSCPASPWAWAPRWVRPEAPSSPGRSWPRASTPTWPRWCASALLVSPWVSWPLFLPPRPGPAQCRPPRWP
jgi:uncharacterized membrane protein